MIQPGHVRRAGQIVMPADCREAAPLSPGNSLDGMSGG
jgi:bifunctional DNA-binding transcriptional regulator/antitoxin component of YhaV-PrlF toxin-antitoxin module